jgi:hypothetical protein
MFEVGQRVLCVDDSRRSPLNGKHGLLNAGAVYEVAAIGLKPASFMSDQKTSCVALVGIKNNFGGVERGFYEDRFRPLDDKDDSVEIFREMCRETEKKILLPLSEERLKELLKDIIW